MTIKILGAGCKNCRIFYENTEAALAQLGIQAKLVKVTDLAQIADFGVMSLPALVVEDRVISSGKVLKPAEIARLLEKAAQ